MDTSVGSHHGKVADRIRVFQDVQRVEKRIPSFHLPPRFLQQHQDLPAADSCGRRERPSCDPLAARLSRDSNEDSQGVGRPRVPTIFYHDVRDLEKLNDQHEHQLLRLRPFTSMDGPNEERNLSKKNTERQSNQHLTRHDGGGDNVANDAALEFAMAKSRLRSVAVRQGPEPGMPEPPRNGTSTIDELNSMLDDAIRDSSPKGPASADERPTNLAPKPGFVLRRTSTRNGRHQSQPRHRISRKTTESVEPQTSDESIRVHYHSAEMEAQHKDSQSSGILEQSDAREPTLPAPPQLKPPQSSSAERSPVKQRAALFETLSKRSELSGHDAVCHHFGHEHESTQDYMRHHPGTPRKEPKKVHRIKFGDRIEERPATPLIPLTLPALVTKEKTSRPQSALESKREDLHSVEPVTGTHTLDDVFEEEHQERKPPLSWPFKWGIFNKGNTLPAQETMAKHCETEPQDVHYPNTRPSVVRNKVREILQAVDGRDDEEQRRRSAEKERLTRRNTRVQPPSRRRTTVDAIDPKPQTIDGQAPTEKAQEEQAETQKAATASKDDSKTPLQRAMLEKQVLAPPAGPEQDNETPLSPRKSLPSTPVRGRSNLVHQPTREQIHSVERQFNLSPTRSASGQRQGVKVEVEIRDSPEREARERGEKIVIIRADVGSDRANEAS